MSKNTQLIELLNDAVVRVQSGDANGTAFWVGPGLLLTCAHVVAKAYVLAKSVALNKWRDEEVEAIVIDYLDDVDLALLQCPANARLRHSQVILSDEYSVGDKLYGFGFTDEYPNGEPFTPEVEGTSHDPTLIKLKSAQVIPGFSGAPLLNLRTGAVCGITRRTRDRSSDLGGRATPISIAFSAFRLLSEVQSELRTSHTKWSDLLTPKQRAALRMERVATSVRDRVAEIYALLHYEVSPDCQVGAHVIPLLLQRTIADYSISRAVAIETDEMTADTIATFATACHTARKTYPSIQGTIVCATLPDRDCLEAARQEGIQVTTFSDLESQLFDARSYVDGIVKDVEQNPRYDLRLFIEPKIAMEPTSKPIPFDNVLSDWLEDPEQKQLTVLGDVGIGKTFLTRVLAYRLAKKFIKSPHDSRVPIRIDLRNADRQFTLEGLLLSHFASNGLSDVTFEVFRHAIRSGRIVLILDGFDEMSAKVTPQVTTRNFQELTRAVEGHAKVLLTCRTHYFRNRTEEEEIVFGDSNDYGSESARELYWDLISRRGFEIVYLREFDFSQIEDYIERVKGKNAPKAIKKIKQIYNLEELCQRPLLLEMIVKSISTLDTNHISAASLYKVFTDAWIHRDKWRDVLTPDDKYQFLEGLACRLVEEDVESIHHSELSKHLETELATRVSDSRQLVEIDNEVRTATFLTRDDKGYYGFAHKSYREFFFARRMFSALVKGDASVLSLHRLSPEEIGFVVDMVNIKPGEVADVARLLEEQLLTEYTPVVSENAVVLLYAIRRGPAWERNTAPSVIGFPSGIKLRRARLNQLDLRGLAAHDAELTEVDFSETVLAGVSLRNAGLVSARLVGADISQADFSHSDCSSADFSEANCEKCNFSYANLSGTLFRDSSIAGTNVRCAVLSSCTVLGGQLKDDAIVPDQDTDLVEYLRTRKEIESAITLWINDPAKFERLGMIIRQAARNYYHGSDIDDVVQEVMIRLWQGVNDLSAHAEKDLGRYVYRIARHVAIDRMRRDRTTSRGGNYERVDLDLDNVVISSEPSPEFAFDMSSITAELEARLSEEHVGILRDRFGGMSYEELGKRYDRSTSSIVRIIARARDVLAQIME